MGVPPHPPISPEARRALCGARFSKLDAAALLVGLAATLALWPWGGAWCLVIPWVLGHFFLFCNLVRLRLALELVWAVLFLGGSAGWVLSGQTSLWPVLVGALPVTALVVGVQLRARDYHGVACERLNPHLETWLQARLSRPH